MKENPKNNETKEKKSSVDKYFAVILTSVIALSAVIVSASQLWIAYNSDKEESGHRELQYNRQAFGFIFEHQEMFGLDEEAKKLLTKELILELFPSNIAESMFKSLLIVSKDDIWKYGKSAATDRANIQSEYLFVITPLNGVELATVEEHLVSNVFPRLKFYQRNIRGAKHSLYQGVSIGGKPQLLWKLELALVGSGSVTSGVEKAYKNVGEALKESAVISESFIKSPRL